MVADKTTDDPGADEAASPELEGSSRPIDHEVALAGMAVLELEDEAALTKMQGRPLTLDDEAALARLLAHSLKPLRLRAAAILSEAISSRRLPEALCERLLESSKSEVRWGAAFAASRAGMRTKRVLDVAIESLDVEDGDVRWAAASIVTREARESVIVRERLRILSANGSPRGRKMALLCLCDSGVADGVLYRAALSDDDSFVRLAALTSLARTGDRSAESLAAIRKVSESDADVRVRRGATAILSRLTVVAATTGSKE
jgi:hypothetical protein